MADVYCDGCGWAGKWEELVRFPKSPQTELCPECGVPDSICESDAAGSDDYLLQEKININTFTGGIS